MLSEIFSNITFHCKILSKVKMKRIIVGIVQSSRPQGVIPSSKRFSINTLKRVHLQSLKNSNKKLQ